jgi:mannosyltransferase
VSSAPTASVFLHRLAASENTPPLIYLLVMAMPGSSPAWLRVPAAIPGALMCCVVYWALRRPLGRPVALCTALAVAVSPYLITYSNLARGFMLADLALLCALWAVLSLRERETAWKWVGLSAASAVAVWTEYASAIFLLALFAMALWSGTPRRRWLFACGALALLTLAPWIHQIVRGQHQVGITKLGPQNSSPSPASLRNMIVQLVFGEGGGTGSAVGRWLLVIVLLAVIVAAGVVLRRAASRHDERWRQTIVLLAGTAVLTVIGHALAAPLGVDVFTPRYLTVEIVLLAALGVAALAELPWKPVLSVAAACLLALGVVDVAKRLGGEWQPNLAAVRAAAIRLHPRTILTDTPVVLYYLNDLHPIMDRPANLGPGDASSCTRPCLAVDDTRIDIGTRRVISGTPFYIEPFELTLER